MRPRTNLERESRNMEWKELSTEALVKEAQDGKERAFEELFRRNESQVSRLAMNITKDRTLAQEVVQDVFLRLFTKIHTFEGRSTLSTWLYRVTLNSSFMVLRSNKRHEYESLDTTSVDRRKEAPVWSGTTLWDAPGDLQLERKELREVIERSLSEMEPHHREVLLMRDWAGLPNKEIASLLGLSLSAAKSCLHRARVFFREQFSANSEPVSILPSGSAV